MIISKPMTLILLLSTASVGCGGQSAKSDITAFVALSIPPNGAGTCALGASNRKADSSMRVAINFVLDDSLANRRTIHLTRDTLTHRTSYVELDYRGEGSNPMREISAFIDGRGNVIGFSRDIPNARGMKINARLLEPIEREKIPALVDWITKRCGVL